VSLSSRCVVALPLSLSLSLSLSAGAASHSGPMQHTDVVKTRMQLQTSAAVGADRYNGMVDCFRKIIATEG
jgi:solute carrier family 25 2-oxodicarboxylate transporter 21